VVYVSHDQEHSEQILLQFEKATGIRVLAHFDTEDTKTVGLVSKILSERQAPVADVFWNNECGQSERLKAAGVLRPYHSPSAATIPPAFKEADGYWTGFAARARVLMWNTEVVSEADEIPAKLEDLAHPRFRSKVAMARPRTGTTLTHLGALYARFGQAWASAWLFAMLENDVRWESGNGQVARSVADGAIAFGLTDTDDYYGRLLEGAPVRYRFLDQEEEQMGTLVIPNSVMLLQSKKNEREAERLVDYLLSPEVEKELSLGRAAQMPLHPGVPVPDHVVPVSKIHVFAVNFSDVGRMIERHQGEMEEMFSRVQGGKLQKASRGFGSLILAFGILAVLGIAMFVFLPKRART
jgi:iron(III) transport system substrate-binding protein